MTANKAEIIFLNRAYNDLDIQLSLIDTFAQDKRFKIRVIGYPCDGDMGSPAQHEASQYITDKHGITFETVLDKSPAPLYLRLIYKFERFLLKLRKKHSEYSVFLRWPLKFVHVGVLMCLRQLLKGQLPWLDKVAKSWNPRLIIMDEAFVQSGRSYMIDHVLPDKIGQGVSVHVIQTGQTSYIDAYPNKAAPPVARNYRQAPQSAVRRFMVPSALDQNAIKENFPQEVTEIHGNLRMDKKWLEKLHNDILVPPYIDKQSYMDKLPKGKGPRVVFMLSKLGYGIKLEELKASIKAVANMHGVSCAIKPHTRGMKFDFMGQDEITDCAIVPDVPSTLLIEWADIVLFTGSSISFHALILGKRAGFLQNCQYLETIFDDGAACDKFDKLTDLTEFLEEWRESGEPEIGDGTRSQRRAWLKDNVHAGVKDGLTADHYKDIISEDFCRT